MPVSSVSRDRRQDPRLSSGSPRGKPALASALFACVSVLAMFSHSVQAERLPLKAYTTADGLPHTDGGLFKSADGGLSLTPVTNGPTTAAIFSLLFDPAAPSTIYAGTSAGVFVSEDDGASWTSMSVGLSLSSSVVNAVVRAPGPGGALYAATNGGLFVFTTELENRAPVTRPAPGHRIPRVVRRTS